MFDVVGSESGSRVVRSSPLPAGRSFTLCLLSSPGSVDERSICGKRENAAFVGDRKVGEVTVEAEDGAGDGGDVGSEVKILLAGWIDDGSFCRRVAVGGTGTWARFAIVGDDLEVERVVVGDDGRKQFHVILANYNVFQIPTPLCARSFLLLSST